MPYLGLASAGVRSAEVPVAAEVESAAFALRWLSSDCQFAVSAALVLCSARGLCPAVLQAETRDGRCLKAAGKVALKVSQRVLLEW